MIAAIFSFFGSPIGKIVGIGLGIIAIAGMAWGMLKIHDAGIRNEALAKFNADQLKQVVEDQQKFNQIQNDIREAQKKLVSDLEKQNKELSTKYSTIQQRLNSPEARKDSTPLSTIEKEIYKDIKGID